VAVQDAFGNPVQPEPGEVSIVASSGRAAQLEPTQGGDCGVAYAASPDDEPGTIDLEVRAGDRTLGHRAVSVRPYQRPWAIVAGAFVAGSWGLAQATAASARVSAGVKLGRWPLELAAEGAFGWTPHLNGVRTVDGLNDASVDMTTWSVALAARYAVPLTVRLSLLISLAAGAQQATTTTSAADTPVFREQTWGPLARGGVGVSVFALRGRVVGLVEYAYAPSPAVHVHGNLAGLSLALGYVASF
jgi:hypothetical protein